jgi:flagellar basal-body rod protein FlgC
MQLNDTLLIAAHGMKAQGDRLRVVSENIANADSAPSAPGESPYRRKMVMFKNLLDKELGIPVVKVTERTYDMSDFKLKYDPNHPSADERGYVTMPNVSPMVEMMDMREARRGYEANLGVVEVARAMYQRTLDLLR